MTRALLTFNFIYICMPKSRQRGKKRARTHTANTHKNDSIVILKWFGNSMSCLLSWAGFCIFALSIAHVVSFLDVIIYMNAIVAEYSAKAICILTVILAMIICEIFDSFLFLSWISNEWLAITTLVLDRRKITIYARVASFGTGVFFHRIFVANPVGSCHFDEHTEPILAK